jgi:hypothetical protein
MDAQNPSQSLPANLEEAERLLLIFVESIHSRAYSRENRQVLIRRITRALGVPLKHDSHDNQEERWTQQ